MSQFSQSVPATEPDVEEIDLRDYIVTLLDARWLIIAITLLGLLLGVFVAWVKTPVYQSDALVQVEDTRGSSIPGLEDLSSVLGESSSADAEIEILRSRRILGSVVDDLHLDIVAEPLRFPLIGEAVARRGGGLPLGWLESWLDRRYGWGDESIVVSSFDVEDARKGEPFYVEVGEEPGSFVLYDADMARLGVGYVGELFTSPGLHLFIASLQAEPGKYFRILRLHRSEAIQGVQDRFSVKEKGKNTGMLSLSLEDEDPLRAKRILDAIANVYLRQNVERKSEEAEKSIQFLARQLPIVKAKMDAAESELNEYRLKHGSIDLKMEAQSILDQVVGVENAIAELDVKVEEIRARYTNEHPAMKTMLSKRQRLLRQKEELLRQVKSLPETEQQILRLTRDAKVNSELYTFLLNKYQELKVVRAGTVGNVRIIDYASLPLRPIRPKKSLILALSATLALMLAVFFVLLRKALNRAIEFPEEVEQHFSLPVYAAIPHSEVQEELDVRGKKGQKKKVGILAQEVPDDQAIESLRSLRTSLHFALLEAKNNLVMISGPSPNIGKSFVSMNFAAVLTQAGQRVLLIDADMRKGRIHRYTGSERSPGLSEVIIGKADLGECVHVLMEERLHVLTSGQIPPNPSELLLHENFSKLLDEVSYMYDIVVIDTPPVLAVTDPVIVGRHCGTNFLLLRAGRHVRKEIQQAYEAMKVASIKVDGVIFNDIVPRSSYYKYSAYYHYQYQYTAKPTES